MDRYQALFAQLEKKNQGAFVPFVTIGDPNPELSYNIMETLIEAGADALELGIPFSDPLADGPTIQGANIRALDSKTTPAICFELITKIRSKYPDTPIGLLVYANLVFANGIDDFYTKCQQAGVDSVLIADVPTNESQEFRESAIEHGIHPIFIAPPSASPETLETVAKLGGGYTYLLSRAGVTGAETKAGMPVAQLLERLNQYDAPPAILGFGISEPAQVEEAVKAGAAGAISGSATVKLIEQHQANPEALLKALADFTSSMKAATQK
ncbi:tryptophan synthase subunit alpha [Aliivibrio fischeri]|uniref:tryptophan synthase subunit alpha n=1 Tax=Aliivibrio fischeri TaxID=668 RepID=UPI0007C5897E|nr:tryptophan synthase subunit alpha [Aliivibrio fischeri]MBP3141592.1 tryptophan synthase subunit alpha [Aliivibrio fischeri]MBP3157789.1 tryptophan synthase subunit alpha [Aliivibrio fischeri]MCE7554077.1 tryptophan synthase subunit alpha [Aliivibrio fischeri]MCE7561071.1 tryptophan synthase subunit alpha [Aliivibrio fischeri]MCE7568479.1 tryptophan synthase subunit alpha [Aliivibrio fischeri]